MKTVGVLIVTYNRLNLLKEEIQSIRKQTFRDFDILVVNNGSTDGTKEWIESQKEVISVTQENVGGAGGFFTGIKYLAEHRYKYCWLMDDDVECKPDALEKLVSVANSTNNLGFLCSRVFGLDGSLMNVPTIDDTKRNGKYASWLERIDEKLIRVKSATFVSILFPLKHAYNLGLPIKEYFIWGDDSEYTNRISQNYDCYMVCDSIVVHKRVLSEALNFKTEKDPQRIANYFYSLRNGFLNKKKFGKKKDVIIEIFYQISLLYESIVKLDFLRMKVLFKVFISELFFKPDIKFPSNN